MFPGISPLSGAVLQVFFYFLSVTTPELWDKYQFDINTLLFTDTVQVQSSFCCSKAAHNFKVEK